MALDCRGKLLATSQAVQGLHSDSLRAEPHRLLRDHSHFGHFLVWAGVNMDAPNLQVYGRKDRSASAPAAAARESSTEESPTFPSCKRAGFGAAARHLDVGGTWPADVKMVGSSADTSPASARPPCDLCGSAMNKAGACHRCWFEKWDSVVHLKNLEQKAASRLESMRTSVPAASTPSAAGPFQRGRSRADGTVSTDPPKRQRRASKR